jgi:hypothetical protein
LHIGWDAFVEAFGDHHIPEAVMDKKADEFRHLKMGGMSVQEYTNRFQELMRYVSDNTNTEKKKVYWFRKGLHKGIAYHLATHDCSTLCSIIDKALTLRGKSLSTWRSTGVRRSALTRQDAQVHPRGRGQVFHQATSHSRALLYPAAVAEQDQPRREWRIKQLEAEITTTSSRQS